MGRSSSCCRNCSKWEKHTYWFRFKLVQFFTVLPKDPHLQLRFPQKFVKNLEEELPESVVLYGPSGHSWNVGLMRSGNDELFIQNGWQAFVNDHNLKEKDVLVFRYYGESRFDVLIFDQSYCEKENAYFVRKCSSEGCKINWKRTERAETGNPPSKKQRCEEAVNERPQSPASGGAKSIPASKRRRTKPYPTRSAVKPKIEKDAEEIYEYGDLNPSYTLHFVSNRRHVSEAEKSRARELADRAGDKSKLPHFLVAMQLTNVSRKFRLTIPIDFVKSYLPHKTEDAILSVEGKKWTAKYYYRVSRGSGFSGSQWADFVLENNLEVGDVCLFELSARKQSEFVLKVGLFRVVEEVVPLKKVTSDMMRGK